MIGRPVPLPGGRFTVPGNRWDLMADGTAVPKVVPAVSVVVPHYANPRQLDLVLAGLSVQDYPVERFEVIVADDGSPRPPAPAVPAHGPRVRVVRQDDLGFRAAAARNLGAGVADGEVLVFLDQDTVPEPAYLRRLTRLPGLVPDALTVGRRRHADLTGWDAARVRAWLTGAGPSPRELPAPGWLADAYRASGDLLDADDLSYRHVISAVMCCSAGLFREMGGFDESFTSYGGEDWEFAHRAWVAGAVFAHVPAAVAWHDGPDWAGRGDADSRREQKAGETEQLARLIPAAPGEPAGGGPADLLVAWTGTSAIAPQRLRAMVDDLSDGGPNVAVYLDPGEPERIGGTRAGTLPLPRHVLARARHRLDLTGNRPVSAAALHHAMAACRPEVGRVTVADPASGRAVTVESLRARHRVDRWQPHVSGMDLAELLFDHVVVMAATPVSREGGTPRRATGSRP